MVLITFCTLQSGSCANAVYVGTQAGAVLIDCGISCRHLQELMAMAGLDLGSVKALLVTHEHSDHVKGAGVLSRRLHIPVYATEGTWTGMEKCIGLLPAESRVVIRAGDSFFLPGMEAVPFAVSHDAAEPVGFRLFGDSASVAVATDTGCVTRGIRDAVYGADLILLESNHDPDMLKRNPNYSSALKARILGKKGHLSNGLCAETALDLLREGTKHIVLGHLSEENNTPALAYETTLRTLGDCGAEQDRDFTLHVAGRYRPERVYHL